MATRTWAAAALVFLVTAHAGAASAERWEATSATASAITGNISFSPDKVVFANRKVLPLAEQGPLPGFTSMGQRVPATLYKVTTPADLTLLRGNSLCDRKPVTFIVVWPTPIVGPAGRAMAAYSGTAPPAVEGGPGFCGTYGYEVARGR